MNFSRSGLVLSLVVHLITAPVYARVLPVNEDLSNPSIDENFSQLMNARIKSEQEWNQRISQDFRDTLSETAQNGHLLTTAFQAHQIESQLNDLSFEIMDKHLNSLAESFDDHLNDHSKVELVQATEIMHPNYEPTYVPTYVPTSNPATNTTSSIGMRNAQAILASQVTSTPEFDFTTNLGRLDVRDTKVAYVEAFDLNSPISRASSKMWSLEPTELDAIKKGWRKSIVSPNPETNQIDHVPTLNWSDPIQQGPIEWVPMLSINDLKGLQSFRNISIQMNIAQLRDQFGNWTGESPSSRIANPDGIVFGKVRAGWEVYYSDQSEAPIFLDMNLNHTADGAIEMDRYFIFLNAKPGSQLLFMTRPTGESGAVAIPVLGDTATYVDLTQVSLRTFNGTVYSARGRSVDEWEPLDATTVRVVGQEALATKSDSYGEFEIEGVIAVGSYPIYVETDRGRGFTHRYKISPRKTLGLSLVRIPVRIVEEWMSQVEVDVDPRSALIVGNLPENVGLKEHSHLFPRMTSLAPSDRSLLPINRTISPWGDLQANSPLPYRDSWFMATQVAEGPLVTHMVEESYDEATRTEAEEVVWAELTMASPGVINVVGVN